ncbi:MAG: S49 family peptidase, partial [Kiloniellales bacterium]|nr:S49 family peptidase [Kiloniellales bacterium]
MGLRSLLSRLPFIPIGEPPPVVAVLRLSGVIGSMGPLRSGLTLSRLAEPIERAFKVKHLKAVALAVNSPGGSPVQSALIANRIRSLAEEKKVKVFAFTEDVAASGGYWLACAADEIYADESSIIGSIGVISQGFGFTEAIQRLGIERRVHTAGDKKSLLDPFREEDPTDVKRLKAIQKEVHESFKDLVRQRREGRLKASERTLFTGEFWTGRKSLELGLVDGLGELRQVMRERYGKKVRLKRVDGERRWWRPSLRIET